MRTGERVTLQEAADALGISEQTARRWIKAGKLKAYRPGLRYLIPASAIEELLEGEAPKVVSPARQPDLEEPAGPVDENQEIHREMLEGFLLEWKQELTRWERKFPAGSRPTVFDYGKLVGWSWAVVRAIERLERETRRNFDLTQRAEMAYTLGRMEDAKQAVRRMLERVSESKTEAEFREILEANDMDAILNNAEPDA